MSVLAPPKRILTVEDNAIVSADVRAILEDAGYDVVPDARDGVQAVEHVRAYAPDLILLDLTLPRLEGVEAASRIREESDVPILVLTGSSDPDTLERASAAGTSGLVRKPFSAHGLLSAVRSRLRRARARRLRLALPGRGDGQSGRGRAHDRAGVARTYRCRAVRGAPHRPAAEPVGEAAVRQPLSAGVRSTFTRLFAGDVSERNVSSALSKPTTASISAALGIRLAASNSIAAWKSSRP